MDDGPVTVTKTDDSTSDAAWLPLAGLSDAMLSPPAIDGLALLRSGAGPQGPSAGPAGGRHQRTLPDLLG
ncbi:hypothetical protein ABZ297_29625 [Nonomuraea sp. NPDC005983]|uniref:hypothetical protein n=1 Tax=Nonomuraea sp. NPDC005983 TaxID=3155595 RepID=UPI0033A58D80